ncbi:FtsH protease activity modulator HflK [Pseudoalteromonas byunsanensis]|uniref:Protein HflK n=1 Tax=Pseudoalteromonas byunsanensis TaxID=327939 RepID=A0A1S1NB07_9GAMM|nr:FtsH protease activity modulator HflK [Pseudoalteromonas byunsanensis]OHU96585.1 HflK protein [Pseudoalteromonas byunsanensis]
MSHNSNTDNPWGGGNKSPPDLDELVKKLPNIKTMLPRGSFSNIATILIFAFLLLTTWSSAYTVPSDSVAVVQRFGKFLAIKQPGLHFKLPFSVDNATTVPVKRQLKQEFGFSTLGSNDPYQSPRNNEGLKETQMVTGDLNAALVEWVVQYRISDPVNFLFEVREPSETLRYVSESVMREVVGDRTVDEVITIGRQEIESQALVKMQSLSTKYAMGLSIDQVQLKNINPPQPVQESFNEVNQAQQQKEKLINEARRDYNKVIPLALGEKDQRIREADGYRLKRINEAQGDASRFDALYAEYIKAPEVTKQRIYLETMQSVLPKVRSKIIIDERNTHVLPLLNLNRLSGEAL